MDIQTPESKFILGSNELENGQNSSETCLALGRCRCYPKEEIEEEKDIEDQIDLLGWTVQPILTGFDRSVKQKTT